MSLDWVGEAGAPGGNTWAHTDTTHRNRQCQPRHHRAATSDIKLQENHTKTDLEGNRKHQGTPGSRPGIWNLVTHRVKSCSPMKRSSLWDSDQETVFVRAANGPQNPWKIQRNPVILIMMNDDFTVQSPLRDLFWMRNVIFATNMSWIRLFILQMWPGKPKTVCFKLQLWDFGWSVYVTWLYQTKSDTVYV